ncbi:MAG: hypothetical protein ACXWJX_02405 [Limisphaerales bacterium]
MTEHPKALPLENRHIDLKKYSTEVIEWVLEILTARKRGRPDEASK